MIPVKLLRKACACAPRRSAGEKEGAAGGSCPPKGRSSRTTVHSRPVLVLPLASTGTGVSSAWRRAPARTWALIASTGGFSATETAPTQSASVEAKNPTKKLLFNMTRELAEKYV